LEWSGDLRNNFNALSNVIWLVSELGHTPRIAWLLSLFIELDVLYKLGSTVLQLEWTQGRDPKKLIPKGRHLFFCIHCAPIKHRDNYSNWMCFLSWPIKNDHEWTNYFLVPIIYVIPLWGMSFSDISFGSWSCKQLALVLTHVGELSGLEMLPVGMFPQDLLQWQPQSFSDHREAVTTTEERKQSPVCKIKQVRQSHYISFTCSLLFLFDLKDHTKASQCQARQECKPHNFHGQSLSSLPPSFLPHLFSIYHVLMLS
jgi:hypothetical protein